MPTPNDVVAHALTCTHLMVNRFTADLQPAEYLHRPTEKANCAAWTIGHLALSDRGALKRMEVLDLPPLPEGFEKRFSRDEGCPQAGDFGDVSQILPVFNTHRERLINAVKSAPPAQFDRPLENCGFSPPGLFFGWARLNPGDAVAFRGVGRDHCTVGS